MRDHPMKMPQRIVKATVNRQASTESKDPVNVYCRLRPLPSEADLSCVRVKNSTTVVLSQPEFIQNKQTTQKETQYIFKHIFEGSSSQRDVFTGVAQPLLVNLLKGKNSLLFTYGVTGSGKTYTMTGNTNERGIMPRCLDVLFRTISDYQAKKFTFKPDPLNGFEILSDADAMLERQAEMNLRFAKSRRKDSDPEIASQASTEPSPISDIDEDNIYAVFITYVEVYNNSVYDLLDETSISKTLQSKIVREDASRNMFVHGVTEVEIKSVEDAMEYFQIGQKRKRMGHTVLNAESSRSHSVFNIRLVQAPTDCHGETVVQDKRKITVSQLSLVDLAGSERTSRTKNTGQRLREAGNINNSLMTLRTCLEYLRENQTLSAQKKIPYRDSKITLLFKNFFEGEGQVSMIVCVNPRVEDFDENAQVMKFAEITQEVQIARATPMKTDYGMMPGRRKANKIFKVAVNNLNDLGHTEAKKLDIDLGVVYSLGPSFPDYKIDSPEGQSAIQELMQYLTQRIEKRKTLCMDLENRCENFRSHLTEIEKENLLLKTELASLKAIYNQSRDRIILLENKVRVHESSLDVLNNKLSNRERQIDELQQKLGASQNLLAQKEQEKEKQKKKFNSKLAVETSRKNKELEIRLREQRQKLQEKMRIKDEKLRLVSNIIKSDDIPNIIRSRSSENVPEISLQAQSSQGGQTTASGRTVEAVGNTGRQVRGVPVANNRHRRSRSEGEKWLEHRAPNPVPLGTILQPYLKVRKSITKLPNVKDLTEKPTRYCLVSQEADTDGDVETKLYKANVIPTCAGGAQVVFDDVECLKQKSPVTPPGNRKRSSFQVENCIAPADITSRCTVGIEGHSCKRSKI